MKNPLAPGELARGDYVATVIEPDGTTLGPGTVHESWRVDTATPAEFCASYNRPTRNRVRVQFTDGSVMDMEQDAHVYVVRPESLR